MCASCRPARGVPVGRRRQPGPGKGTVDSPTASPTVSLSGSWLSCSGSTPRWRSSSRSRRGSRPSTRTRPVRTAQAHDTLHGGGLAGSVRAQDAEDFAVFHAEADVVHRHFRAVALVEVLDVDGCRGWARRPCALCARAARKSGRTSGRRSGREVAGHVGIVAPHGWLRHRPPVGSRADECRFRHRLWSVLSLVPAVLGLTV